MAKEVKIPQISEGVESATVAEILVSKGDTVKEEDSLIVVESDKASVEVPSPFSGIVKDIMVKEGDEVKVGDVIVTLDEQGGEEEKAEAEEEKEGDKKQKKEKSESEEESKDKGSEEKEEQQEEEKKSEKKESKEDKKEEKPSASEQESEEEEDSEEEAEEEFEADEKEEASEEDKEKGKEQKSAGGAAASPKVRRLARELGVDINAVEGSGENGRISEEDVKAFVKQKGGGTGAAALSLPDFSKWGETERKPLSGIRKATGKNVTASWQNIPHVFQFEEADISGIEDYMEKHAEKAEKAGGKLTITAILLKISAAALRQFPKFNASIDPESEEMILKKYMNIGIAVDTEKGLLVPVIKDVDRKSIIELSVELTKIAEKAREGKLSPEEMQGGNFTISNLGGIGGTNFTPIIYHPQVAILGVSRAKVQPVWKNDQFEPRQVLPLSLSYDHRLIDGAEGAAFIHWMAQALEDPYEALLGS